VTPPTPTSRIVLTESFADYRTVTWAIAVAFVTTAGVAELQRAVPWSGTRTEFLILASVMAVLSLVAAVFFRIRGRIVQGDEDSNIGLIFLLMGCHFTLRILLEPLGLGVARLATIVLISWVLSQLGSALILLVSMGHRFHPGRWRSAFIAASGVIFAAASFGLALHLKHLDVLGTIQSLNAAIASTFLAATAITLIQAFRERKARTIWLGSAFIVITAGHTDLSWSQQAYDSSFMWGHVLLLIGLTIPLAAAVAENLSLLSSQARLTRRVRRLGRRVEALLDSLPVLVLTLDAAGNLKYANRRAHELLGVPAGTSSRSGGPVWTGGFSQEDTRRLLEDVGHLTHGGPASTARELHLTAPGGGSHWLAIELRSIHDPVEDKPRVLLTGAEITDLLAAQRTAERRHERLSLLTNLAQSIGVEATEERILTRFFELTGDQLGLTAAAILRPEPDQTRLRVSQTAGASLELRELPSQHPLLELALKSYHDGFPQVSTKPAFDEPESGPSCFAVTPLLARGRSVGVLAMAGDGSWPTGAPEDLDVLLQVGTLVGGALHLGDVLKELEEQRRLALQASRLKSEFLANTSHELRTPLSSILGFLNLILEGHISDPEKQRRFLEIAHNSARRLLGIINDVLDLAKIEAGRLETRSEMTPVGPILQDLYALFRHQARDKGVELDVSSANPDLEVFADPDRTRQILTNLLSNALKFTPAQGSISLEVSWTAENVLFSVRDTGPGIPPGEQERVFESFHQVDGSTTRAAGGTGLGLTISRQLAEKMGGDLTLESAGTGQGTTVRLLLPRHPQDRR